VAPDLSFSEVAVARSKDSTPIRDEWHASVTLEEWARANGYDPESRTYEPDDDAPESAMWFHSPVRSGEKHA
jgi:hypothetical protein